MKKIFLGAALLAMIVLGASCNKTKICQCKYTVNILGYETTTELPEKTIESGSCSDLENAATWNVPGITEGSIHCEKKK